MKKKKFRCSECMGKFDINEMAYFNCKEVCRNCFNKLKRKQKSKFFQEKKYGKQKKKV